MQQLWSSLKATVLGKKPATVDSSADEALTPSLVPLSTRILLHPQRSTRLRLNDYEYNDLVVCWTSHKENEEEQSLCPNTGVASPLAFACMQVQTAMRDLDREHNAAVADQLVITRCKEQVSQKLSFLDTFLTQCPDEAVVQMLESNTTTDASTLVDTITFFLDNNARRFDEMHYVDACALVSILGRLCQLKGATRWREQALPDLILLVRAAIAGLTLYLVDEIMELNTEHATTTTIATHIISSEPVWDELTMLSKLLRVVQISNIDRQHPAHLKSLAQLSRLLCKPRFETLCTLMHVPLSMISQLIEQVTSLLIVTLKAASDTFSSADGLGVVPVGTLLDATTDDPYVFGILAKSLRCILLWNKEDRRGLSLHWSQGSLSNVLTLVQILSGDLKFFADRSTTDVAGDIQAALQWVEQTDNDSLAQPRQSSFTSPSIIQLLLRFEELAALPTLPDTSRCAILRTLVAWSCDESLPGMNTLLLVLDVLGWALPQGILQFVPADEVVDSEHLALLHSEKATEQLSLALRLVNNLMSESTETFNFVLNNYPSVMPWCAQRLRTTLLRSSDSEAIKSSRDRVDRSRDLFYILLVFLERASPEQVQTLLFQADKTVVWNLHRMLELVKVKLLLSGRSHFIQLGLDLLLLLASPVRTDTSERFLVWLQHTTAPDINTLIPMATSQFPDNEDLCARAEQVQQRVRVLLLSTQEFQQSA